MNLNDGSEDGEFRNAIRVLADRVGHLVQQRAELVERCTIAEANQALLKKDLENQAELLKGLYSKRKFDKQVQVCNLSNSGFVLMTWQTCVVHLSYFLVESLIVLYKLVKMVHVLVLTCPPNE